MIGTCSGVKRFTNYYYYYYYVVAIGGYLVAMMWLCCGHRKHDVSDGLPAVSFESRRRFLSRVKSIFSNSDKFTYYAVLIGIAYTHQVI